ncbi:MAG: hypothetical protein IPG23_16180 [Burkholderiales bacterium]|nr:hypothetical protein [Burkholderiales bacterium]
MNKKSAELPTTIDGAARLMLGLVPEDEQTRISHMRENDLTEPHGTWSMGQKLPGAVGCKFRFLGRNR